jgi:hypothetical protein
MLKKPIWSTIEITLFYYCGDIYNRASLHATKPPTIEGSNGQTLNKKNTIKLAGVVLFIYLFWDK